MFAHVGVVCIMLGSAISYDLLLQIPGKPGIFGVRLDPNWDVRELDAAVVSDAANKRKRSKNNDASGCGERIPTMMADSCDEGDKKGARCSTVVQ